MSRDIYIIGAGGHAAVVAELSVMLGYQIVAFIDDDPSVVGRNVFSWQVAGGRSCVPDGSTVALGIGSNEVRLELLSYADIHGWHLPTLVHPSAVISSSAELAHGTVVMPQAVVNARTRIGQGCVLNTACSVDHDCVLADTVHICPGARLAGAVTVGDCAFIGIGSSVKQCVTIGAHTVVGAGSAVVNDIPDRAIAYGVPARIMGKHKSKKVGAMSSWIEKLLDRRSSR